MRAASDAGLSAMSSSFVRSRLGNGPKMQSPSVLYARGSLSRRSRDGELSVIWPFAETYLARKRARPGFLPKNCAQVYKTKGHCIFGPFPKRERTKLGDIAGLHASGVASPARDDDRQVRCARDGRSRARRANENRPAREEGARRAADRLRMQLRSAPRRCRMPRGRGRGERKRAIVREGPRRSAGPRRDRSPFGMRPPSSRRTRRSIAQDAGSGSCGAAPRIRRPALRRRRRARPVRARV